MFYDLMKNQFSLGYEELPNIGFLNLILKNEEERK